MLSLPVNNSKWKLSIIYQASEADVAQQVGRFSDQVQMGSPAAEAGELGKASLKDIIEESEKKLAKKVQKENKETE